MTPERQGRPPDPLDTETVEAIFEITQLLVVVLDRDARIRRFNPACERTTGYRADEMLGQTVWKLVPDDERDSVEFVFHELVETGRANLHENDWLAKDGERRCIAWTNTAILDDDGEIDQVIGTGIDVTDLRASEARARTSDTRLGGILHSAMDAIVSIDEEQRIMLFNPAAERMFGWRPDEILGRPIDDLIPARFRDLHRDHVERFAASGRTSRRMNQLGEVWGLRADGEEFPIEASISQVSSEDGTLLTVIARDMSERRDLEEQLRQTRELAAIATLVAGIAHDIGTPMNVILGYTDMLAGSIEGEKNRERLAIIRAQVERVTRLIGTLMNFARPGEELARSARVEDILERALGLIGETARKRGITITRDFAPAAPLLCQPERLERAFLDLFVNGCDAMQEKGGTLGVTTRDRAEGIEIEIADTGMGIPPDVLRRIFEPFYTTKPRGQGSGLGLLVTRGIVAEHGGTIHVKSEPGVGTSFTIRFPGEGVGADGARRTDDAQGGAGRPSDPSAAP